MTTPNVVHTGNPVWVKQSDQTNSSLLSLGGGPLRGNNYTIDGVSMTDLRNRSVIIPVFDAVEELKVQTNTYDAEMGRTGGGGLQHNPQAAARTTGRAVRTTSSVRGNWTPSGASLRISSKGTSTVGCSAETIWATPHTTSSAVPSAVRSSRGGRFSGSRPKDISDNAIGNTTVTLPTPAEAAGDFSSSGATIYDPFSRSTDGVRLPLPNNRVPAGRVDPTGSALTGLLASLGPGGRISTSGIQRVRAIQATGNLSHSVGEKWNFSMTFLHYRSEEPLFGHYQDLLNSETRPDFGIGSSLLGRNVRALAVNATTVLTPASVLTLRYGQTYFDDSWSSPEFGKEDLRTKLDVQGSFLDKIYSQDGYKGQFPSISVADFGDGGNTHGGRTNDDVNWTSQETSGSYSVFVGNHTLKLGAQWRRLGLHTVNFGNGFALDFAKRFTQGPDPAHPVTGSGSAPGGTAAGRAEWRCRDTRVPRRCLCGLLGRLPFRTTGGPHRTLC